jgi:hypothetical protein
MKYLVALLMLVVTSAIAGPKVQTFELGKPMEDRVFLCLDVNDVLPMFDMAVAGDMEMVKMLSFSAVRNGKCGAFPVEITYKKLIKEGKDAEGNLFTIYEAVVDGITVYVPLRNYRHRGDA